jgi:hypothetical protein
MANGRKFLISVTIFGVLFVCMVTSTVIFQNAYAISQKDKNAKKTIVDAIEEKVDTKWSEIDMVNISKASDNNTVVILNNTVTPPSNATNCPINATFNQTKYVRLASVGDTDANSGTKKEFQMMKDCGVQIHIIPGDLWYKKDPEDWFNLAHNHGFTPENTNIAVGNHDENGQEIKEWLGEDSTWNMKSFADGKVDICAIDSNNQNDDDEKFVPVAQQLTDIKNNLTESDALYKICAIHHPFMTVHSEHPNNGAFDTFHQIFKNAGVSIVLEAHNHNYQRFKPVENILYLLTGTGTHDCPPCVPQAGGSLYPTDGNDDGNGHTVAKKIRENGITIIDLQIDNPNQKHSEGWFINLDKQIKDHFINGNTVS